MKTFKDFMTEDVELLNQKGFREFEDDAQKDFKFKPEELDKPVNSIGDYDVYQLHHGYGGERYGEHTGFGRFIDLSDPKSQMKFTSEGGRFGVFHRPTGKIAGYLNYYMDPRKKEVEIKDLKGVEGHKNVRSMLFDTITDKLGYTLVSDETQTEKGVRGWKKDIADGKNIKVRYHHGMSTDGPYEVSAENVPHEHIWAKKTERIPHALYPKIQLEPSLVNLVRYPSKKS
jgi:hypothetical protein